MGNHNNHSLTSRGGWRSTGAATCCSPWGIGWLRPTCSPTTRLLANHPAQDLSNHYGKIIRLHDDGRVPAANPFVGRAGARPEIWSY